MEVCKTERFLTKYRHTRGSAQPLSAFRSQFVAILEVTIDKFSAAQQNQIYLPHSIITGLSFVGFVICLVGKKITAI